MPTNKELAAEAEALAAELELEAPTTEGLNNAELAALVKELKAKRGDDVATEEAKAKAAARKAGAVEPTEKPPYYMAPGKAITSLKGILSGDTEDEVKAEMLSGGETALKSLVKSGHIIKS